MKVALGTITKDFNDPAPVLRFLDNARMHGHGVDRLIVGYSHTLDLNTVERVRREVQLDLVHSRKDNQLRSELRELGLGPSLSDAVLGGAIDAQIPETPYGVYRNAVLIKALLRGMDYLLFFDDDTHPRILTEIDGEQPDFYEIDFIGEHLTHLSQRDTTATTCDYSGYSIVPPMLFDGIEEFLTGLGKEAVIDYVLNCQDHGCLNLGSTFRKQPEPTSKLLGGNLGLSLDLPWRLQPFYSTIYQFEERWILGRGEDTLLGQAISGADGIALDIQLPVFHDTYGDFPVTPETSQQTVKDRFYNACLGWIGRNPFLLWHQEHVGFTGLKHEQEIARQRENLQFGAPQAASHFDDPRFLRLPSALDASVDNLAQSVIQHELLMRGWEMLIQTLKPELVDEPLEVDGNELRLAS
jgi:hypothetical protein